MRSSHLRRRVGELVRIHRKALEPFHFDAYVHDVSDAFVLIQAVTDRIDLDGYDVLRCEDISRVVASPRRAYQEKALALKRQRPKKPKGIALDTVPALLESVNAAYPLLVIHRELARPDVCEVGQVLDIAAKGYRLRWISPDAVFETRSRRYRLVDVTRVQFDNAYERTLAMVADLPNRG